MSHTPENSAIRMTPDVEAQINAASPEEIKSILAQAAVQQGLVTRDIYDPQVLLPTELASAAPRAFAKTVVINNVKHILQSDSEAGLLAAENALFRQLFESGQTQQHDQSRDAQGRFVEQQSEEHGSFQTEDEKNQAALEAGRKFDLEMKFKRGEISAAQYLDQSGAIAEYLAGQGIDVNLLAEASAVRQEENYEDAWSTATQEFLNSPEGASWPGGEANMLVLGHIIQENPELMSTPSVNSLVAAYEYAREHNLLVSNPEIEIANAQSPSELRNLLQPPARRAAVENGMSTGLFNR